METLNNLRSALFLLILITNPAFGEETVSQPTASTPNCDKVIEGKCLHRANHVWRNGPIYSDNRGATCFEVNGKCYDNLEAAHDAYNRKENAALSQYVSDANARTDADTVKLNNYLKTAPKVVEEIRSYQLNQYPVDPPHGPFTPKSVLEDLDNGKYVKAYAAAIAFEFNGQCQTSAEGKAFNNIGIRTIIEEHSVAGKPWFWVLKNQCGEVAIVYSTLWRVAPFHYGFGGKADGARVSARFVKAREIDAMETIRLEYLVTLMNKYGKTILD